VTDGDNARPLQRQIRAIEKVPAYSARLSNAIASIRDICHALGWNQPKAALLPLDRHSRLATAKQPGVRYEP